MTIAVARTAVCLLWQLIVALALTAVAAALWTLAMGSSGFIHTFVVTLFLVGGVLLIFGAGAMTFQITWKGSVSKAQQMGEQPLGTSRRLTTAAHGPALGTDPASVLPRA